MLRNWTFTFYYCLSELWGDVGLSLLFWSFANEITHIDQAPVLYPLFGFGANFAQIIGGLVLKMYASVEFKVSFHQMTLQMMACMGLVVVLHNWIAMEAKRKEASNFAVPLSGTIRNGRFRHANGHKNTTSAWENGNSRKGHVLNVSWRKLKGDSRPKEKKSFLKALQTLTETPQIRCLAIMTIAQSLSVTLMEFLWKCHLRIAYPTPEAFTGFLGEVSTATGIITALLMFASPIIFRKMEWGDVATITPNVMLWGGIIFFSGSFMFLIVSRLQRLSIAQSLMMPIVLSGAMLFIVSRGAKFSLFKPAEEMVYITLDEESRTKGKAAVDVVGSQVGKSGGSVLQQVK